MVDRSTYHRPQQGVLALVVLLQSILLVLGTLDDGRNASLPDVFQDRLDLLWSRGLLSDVEFKLVAVALSLDSMVASLVDSRARGSIRRGSLEDVGHTDRGRGLGRVEESDDVEGFVLSRTIASVKASYTESVGLS